MKELTKTNTRSIATDLSMLEYQIHQMEERRKELRDQLLQQLKKQGVKSVKLNDGTTYTRAERVTLKVKDEEKAWAWAKENYSLKIDTAAAMQILRRELKLPKFFTKQVSEYLVVK